MFKRTAAHILLVLLVITGFGSQVSNSTLDSKERRILIKHLKDSKAIFLVSIKGLTKKQLEFKPAGSLSVNECIRQLTIEEKALWSWAQASLHQPAQLKERGKIKLTDNQVFGGITGQVRNIQAPKKFGAKAVWINNTDAVNSFKKQRTELIKYVKTTTEDVRSHTIRSEAGSADVYQLLILISANTTWHSKQIEKIKALPGYPQ